MLVCGTDTEPRIDAPGRIDDEVGEGLVEGPNGMIDVVLEKERVYRR